MDRSGGIFACFGDHRHGFSYPCFEINLLAGYTTNVLTNESAQTRDGNWTWEVASNYQ